MIQFSDERQRWVTRPCRGHDDFIGAFCEVMVALANDDYHQPSRGVPGVSAAGKPYLLDPDAGGYEANARKQLEQ